MDCLVNPSFVSSYSLAHEKYQYFYGTLYIIFKLGITHLLLNEHFYYTAL